MNDVRRPQDDPFPGTPMVLQFHQEPHFYRMVFELLENPLGPPNDPIEAMIITMFHDGNCPGLPLCEVQELDGTYDLPEENIK